MPKLNRRSRYVPCLGWCGVLGGLLPALAAGPVRTLVVTQDLVLPSGAAMSVRLVVRANFVTIDGQGATLVGPGTIGDPKSLESAGVGIRLEGVTGVTLKNIRVRGFATGLQLRAVEAAMVTDCDFSDNYDNPQFGWGELPSRGGIVGQEVRRSVIRRNRANRVWDGLVLTDSTDNLVTDNDFSHCSNTCAKLWHASRNQFLQNSLAYGLRIDRAKGEVHARDSTGVLIETGSNDNYWYRNNITHGGDGLFIRPLNRWVS
ncbi:MAG: right-handed parallel beta-helix repeat-containing protein, partial [Verrucomicrobia bacterium]|nr:right-handed parallel beta-helix repeat-containing protein [Verrucomicrobiota bacterium]